MAPVLELDNLRVQLGRREILKGLSCRLGVGGDGGRAIGLLGPNGAGKSTLIQTMLGFHPPLAGSAKLFGYDCHRNPKEVRARLGYMPENDSFIANMSAVSFLRMMGELSGMPRGAALEKAHETLFHVGLGEARYRKLGTYSLGMKQMAKLAQAIIHGPDLVILDEPTNGLDPAARQRMLTLIHEIKGTHKMHVLLCSHLLRDVEETCDEVLILKDGLIVHHANLEEERRSNRRFVELELAGAAAGFAAALGTLGAAGVDEGDGRWRIVLPADVEIAALWRVAAERRLQVRKLTYRRDTLEEIFLKAVGHIQATPGDATKPPPLPEPVGAEVTHGRL
jgi:ABC-2 type transport system ATP-binding protein